MGDSHLICDSPKWILRLKAQYDSVVNSSLRENERSEFSWQSIFIFYGLLRLAFRQGLAMTEINLDCFGDSMNRPAMTAWSRFVIVLRESWAIRIRFTHDSH